MPPIFFYKSIGIHINNLGLKGIAKQTIFCQKQFVGRCLSQSVSVLIGPKVEFLTEGSEKSQFWVEWLGRDRKIKKCQTCGVIHFIEMTM